MNNKQIPQISVHFQTKTQTPEQVNLKFETFLNKEKHKLYGRKLLDLVDYKIVTIGGSNEIINTEEDTVVNHCFLPIEELKKTKKDLSVYEDFIEVNAEHESQS